MTTTAKKAASWKTALPKRVSEFQRQVEKEVRKNWERATDMLPPVPRKAVKRMTANVDRARVDLVKRSDKLLAETRKRAERIGTGVRKRFEDVVMPVANRLDLASRADVERLRKRLHELERRMESSQHSPAA